MKTLVIASKNKDKAAEIARVLKGLPFQVRSLNYFPPCKDVEETGKTFIANAKLKARFYSKHTKSLVLADDSGLMVNALNGRPGVYSARFAGVGCSYADNNKKLLKLLKGKPDSKRNAKFVCVIALYDNGKFIKSVRGECRGKIAHEVRGKNGFGYDPIFIPDGFTKTYAELDPAEKNKISHRGRALDKSKKFLAR